MHIDNVNITPITDYLQISFKNSSVVRITIKHVSLALSPTITKQMRASRLTAI